MRKEKHTAHQWLACRQCHMVRCLRCPIAASSNVSGSRVCEAHLFVFCGAWQLYIVKLLLRRGLAAPGGVINGLHHFPEKILPICFSSNSPPMVPVFSSSFLKSTTSCPLLCCPPSSSLLLFIFLAWLCFSTLIAGPVRLSLRHFLHLSNAVLKMFFLFLF